MTVKATRSEEISMMLETARGPATTETWENMDQMERNLARPTLGERPAPMVMLMPAPKPTVKMKEGTSTGQKMSLSMLPFCRAWGFQPVLYRASVVILVVRCLRNRRLYLARRG